MTETEQTPVAPAEPRHVSRAKFYCASSKRWSADPAVALTEYEFNAVYDNGIEENKRFARYSPTGRLSISVDNPAVDFQVGKSYYLDFIEAEQ